jgi:hypothetical protein
MTDQISISSDKVDGSLLVRMWGGLAGCSPAKSSSGQNRGQNAFFERSLWVTW